jgi:hypothetical protein
MIQKFRKKVISHIQEKLNADCDGNTEYGNEG